MAQWQYQKPLHGKICLTKRIQFLLRRYVPWKYRKERADRGSEITKTIEFSKRKKFIALCVAQNMKRAPAFASKAKHFYIYILCPLLWVGPKRISINWEYHQMNEMGHLPILSHVNYFPKVDFKLVLQSIFSKEITFNPWKYLKGHL